jgi:hypothetical protein
LKTLFRPKAEANLWRMTSAKHSAQYPASWVFSNRKKLPFPLVHLTQGMDRRRVEAEINAILSG